MILKKIIPFVLILFISNLGFSEEKFTLSGTISDANSNETLIGVNIIAKDTKLYATTNEYGFYSLTLPKGDYEILISYVGFTTISEAFSLNQNTKRNFSLQ